MILQFATFLLLAWLPGAVLFRLPVLDREKRARLDGEERLFWAVILSVVLSTAVALALALASHYTFERLLIANALITATAALAARLDLRLGSSARRTGLSALLPLTLVVISLWRFFPSSEYVMGGKDPGTYINEGLVIAQRGAVVYRDPVVAAVPPFARDLFFPSHRRADYYGLRFMGFWITNPDTGAVVGQFPHVFPASIAIGYGLDGLTGARRAVGFWSILGVLALYFMSVRLVGRAAAWAAAGLLCLHVLQVWFARYPNAEVVMQALLFAALLASARAHVDDDRFFAPVAGFLLGFLLFLRFDAILGVAAVVSGLALGHLAGAVRLRVSFFAALLLTAAAAIAYLFAQMRAYLSYPIVFFSNFKLWQYAILAAAAAVVAAALAIGARRPALAARVRTFVPAALTLALIALAVYALLFRVPIDRVLHERDAYALRTFAGFYLTVPGLLAALAGFALLARYAFWRAPETFFTLAVFACFFFYKIRIASDHFWMARRFLPVILPGALMLIAAAAVSRGGSGRAPSHLLRKAIGVMFIAVLATQYARAAAPILPHVEYAGLIPKLEQIAAQVHDRDLLLVESRDASDTHVLALPLAYIYARNVLVLNNRKPDKASFAAFLDWARTRHERVLFMGGGGTDLLSPAWSARPMASERFEIPEYDAPADAYPRFVRHKEFDYSLYEIVPPDGIDESGPFDLDVGVNDDLNVLRFHSKEQSENRTFRWSRDRSYVSINHVDANNREVELVMNDGGRPPAVPPAEVTVSLDGVVLGTVTVSTGFRPYRLSIPPALADRVARSGSTAELALATTTWKPEKVLGTADDRDLGVMLDRVTVR
ncbi:MAG TPA: hypothetical protein VFJ02_19810 [Vicinamibacterales bacterium]|nr:hypothetical protein [Vicinamibacterales bacterium]